jgi:hypothetical protein
MTAKASSMSARQSKQASCSPALAGVLADLA